MQKKGIGPIRGCLSAVVVVVVLIIIIGVVASGSSSTKDQHSGGKAAAVKHTPDHKTKSSSGDSERAAARSWITKMHHDWNDVQVSV